MKKCFFPIESSHEFSIYNLPYGVFSTAFTQPRIGVAIGDYVLDLSVISEAGLFSFDSSFFYEETLNAFMAQSRKVWVEAREAIQKLLSEDGDPRLKNDEKLKKRALIPLSDVQMHLPAKIGDYTDFYSSREHATNVGIMFRGKENALQPNWLHLPVGYHGRASSVVVSGTPVIRPQGQLQADANDDKKGSVYGACRLLDFELEVGAFVGGKPNALGSPISMETADEHIFGLVLMNDWSARDIQKWEYVPLGPFTAKNFATTISPWVVSMEALRPFVCRTSAGVQDNPLPLPYLQDPQYSSYDVTLEVALQTETIQDPHPITRSNFRHLYWNIRQQLVHHTVTGCNLQPGDLLGSGTISGSDDTALGSMLELSWKGSREISLPDGSTRKFLKDGDNVILRGWSQGEGFRVGFGVCEGKILPAASPPPPSSSSSGQIVEEKAEARYTDLRLYGYWRSSCTWRVRVALAAKGLDYEYIPVHLVKGEQTSSNYSALNPQQQVPSLEVTDRSTGQVLNLFQSVAICEFLEEAFPKRPALLPPRTSPFQRALARKIVEMINSGIQPLQNLSVMEKISKESSGACDGKAFGRDAIVKGLEALEATLKKTAGSFSVGNRLTLADAALVPQLYNARRFGVDLSLYPTLVKVESQCSQLPAFQAAHPEKQIDAQN